MEYQNRRQRVLIWYINPIIGLGSLLAYLAGGSGQRHFLTAAICSLFVLVAATVATVRQKR